MPTEEKDEKKVKLTVAPSQHEVKSTLDHLTEGNTQPAEDASTTTNTPQAARNRLPLTNQMPTAGVLKATQPKKSVIDDDQNDDQADTRGDVLPE